MNPVDVPRLVSHHLEFQTGRYEIAEPLGWDAAEFIQKEADKRVGRDVEFSPQEMTFVPGMRIFDNGDILTYEFERLIDEYKTNGWESDVKYLVGIRQDQNSEPEIYVVGELDFFKCKTDRANYFTCSIIQETSQAIVDRRKDIKVDLLSSVDSFQNPMTPLTPVDLLLRAIPEVQKSEYEAVGDFESTLLITAQYAISPLPVINLAQIEDTISPQYGTFLLTDTADVSEMYLVEAQNNLTKLKINLSDLNYDFGSGNTASLYWEIGTTYAGILGSNENDSVTIPISSSDYDLEIELPDMLRTQKLWVFFIINNNGTTNVSLSGGKITIETTSIAFSSVVKAFKLYDVMEQVIKSISGLSIDAPRFLDEFNGQYITTGNLIRNLTDVPVNISLKQIRGWMDEVRGDYEALSDRVFFGLWEDFRQDVKIGSFKSVPSTEYEEVFNEKYGVNTLEWKYKKYEKENDELDSREGAHTELQAIIPNQRVENSKKITIEFIRDSPLLESTRKDANRIEDTTATRQDEQIFIVDTVEGTASFVEAFYVRHVIVEAGTILRIVNDGSLNFTFLGIIVNQFITIDGQNAGDYLVTEIKKGYMELTASGSADPQTSGLELTNITYNVNATSLMNRTNEGFDIISGTATEQGMSNLNFTMKRNLVNYWGKYLLTACEFRINEKIIIPEYVHNRTLRTQKAGEGELLEEGADIDLGDIALNGLSQVTPYMVKRTVLCDFADFWSIRQKLRESGTRGYVEVLDSEEEVVNLFPTMLSYSVKDGELLIEGELRNDPQDIEVPDDRQPYNPYQDYRFEDGRNYEFEDGENYEFDDIID